jgi:hypothetical protein
MGAEKTSVEATERLAKRRVSLERVDERSSLPNSRMPSPVLSKVGAEYR